MKTLREEIENIIKPGSYDVMTPGVILTAQIRDLSALFRQAMEETIGEDEKGNQIMSDGKNHVACVRNQLRAEQRERANKLTE